MYDIDRFERLYYLLKTGACFGLLRFGPLFAVAKPPGKFH
jgi:hypothetical protein